MGKELARIADLEARIAQLEKQLNAAVFQLNNHVCDRSAPVVINPWPQPSDGTTPWPNLPFIVNVS